MHIATAAGMMQVMSKILDFIHEHLDARSLPQVEEVARATGVPFHTIAKIKRRETVNPKIETVQSLLNYFKAHRKPKAKQEA